MDLQLSPNRYQLDIPRQVWSEFLQRFNEDNRGRLITLKILDCQHGDFELLSQEPLFSVVYEPPDRGNDLVVTVSRNLTLREATYSHPIVYPQTMQIITDADGIIQSCTITDDDRAQTIICLEQSCY
jgi:hypothetical protein